MSVARYAVFGDPVAHSWSPQIHAAFAAQTGSALRYEAVRVSPDKFAETVRAFFQGGGAGLNITLPHKQAAFALAQVPGPAAAAAAAANTLWCEADGLIHCDNTDGRGLVRDLMENHGVTLADRSILLLGAGGAARSVLGALLATGVARLHVANRTVARAEEMLQLVPDHAGVTAGGLEHLPALPPFDVVISALSAGLHGALPTLPDHILTADACCYDMIYAAAPTAFQAWARAAGAAQALDGLGMLVEQAAESFLIWRGQRPDTAPVIRQLRAALV